MPISKKITYTIQNKVIIAICVAATCFGIFFGISVLGTEHATLAIVNITFGCVFFAFGLRVYKKPQAKSTVILIVSVACSLFMYLYVSGGVSGSGMMWGLLVPLAGPFFLGFGVGLIVSVCYLAVAIALLAAGPAVVPGLYPYALAVVARFIGVYMVLASIALVYEYSRIKDSKRLMTEARSRKESEEKLSTLFTAMTEMVVLHELVYNDLDQVVNYRIVDCNEAFTRITGIARSDALEKLATDLYGTENAPYLQQYALVAQSGQPVSFTAHYSAIDKYFAVSAVQTKPDCFATITSDITDRKLAEETLAATLRETEQINRLMSGREDRVLELKREVNTLSKELGRNVVYPSVIEEA